MPYRLVESAWYVWGAVAEGELFAKRFFGNVTQTVGTCAWPRRVANNELRLKCDRRRGAVGFAEAAQEELGPTGIFDSSIHAHDCNVGVQETPHFRVVHAHRQNGDSIHIPRLRKYRWVRSACPGPRPNC